MEESSIESREPRALEAHEVERLHNQEPASEFKVRKLEREARKNWDRFYHRNTDNFFKDRHWSREDLVELCPHINLQDSLVFVEAGCGVGNMLFPLVEYFPSWTLFGFDFSQRAIGLLNERARGMDNVWVCVADLCDSANFPPPLLATVNPAHPQDTSPVDVIPSQSSNHLKSTCCNDSGDTHHTEQCSRLLESIEPECDSNGTIHLSQSGTFHPVHSSTSSFDPAKPRSDIPDPAMSQPDSDPTLRNSSVPPPFNGADLTTLIFVLSAIEPSKHAIAVSNVSKVVRRGGTMVVRDYGVNDHAMVRFGRGAKLADRFYARQDGTRAYYFQLEELEGLFVAEGFSVVRSEYLSRRTVNHAKGLSVERVFVQAVFLKDRI